MEKNSASRAQVRFFTYLSRFRDYKNTVLSRTGGILATTIQRAIQNGHQDRNCTMNNSTDIRVSKATRSELSYRDAAREARTEFLKQMYFSASRKFHRLLKNRKNPREVVFSASLAQR